MFGLYCPGKILHVRKHMMTRQNARVHDALLAVRKPGIIYFHLKQDQQRLAVSTCYHYRYLGQRRRHDDRLPVHIRRMFLAL